MRKNKKLLLVDLDGVLIASHDTDSRTHQMIYSLHGNHTSDDLANNQAKIAVLTHRHKAEAEQILKFLGIGRNSLARFYTAQDLWLCARKYKQVAQTLLKGMRKSLVLPLIKDELGYHPKDIAIIDDRPGILSDMTSSGVGLTLLAPFQFNNSHKNNDTITFDLSEMLRVFEKWSNDTLLKPRQYIRLKERVNENNRILSKGAVIIRSRWDPFSLARSMTHGLRRLLIQSIL